MRNCVKKIVLVFSVVLVIGTFILFKYFSSNKIERVLKSESYNYLPMEAKNYIKDVYEKTGNIILTEKNKKDNTPYLNPDYINYISSIEKENIINGVIPSALVTDYKASNYEKIDNLPSSFDLRNANGKNYLTPMKDQGSLGLCWAIASLEHVESNLMYTNKKPYDENTKLLSIRQMDYATSKDGINNYENEFGARTLTSGGNFYISSFAMSNGITITSNEKMPYDYSKNKKELYEVLNFENSLYEVNSTITMSRLTTSSTNEDKESYNNIVKSNIYKYGSAYVATGSPKGSCGAYNTLNKNYVIVDTTCSNYSNYGSHAMQIIGWDDNYKYSVCSNGKSTTQYDGNCSSGYNLVSGTGAWILRNSWGTDEENLDYQYVYLAYDSYGIDIAFVTDISQMKDKKWDNNYHDNLWKKSGGDEILSQNFTFRKKIKSSETISKIKFSTLGQDGSYTLKIKSNNLDYTYSKDIITTLPGIYTIDLSNENIILEDDVISINIESKNNVYLLRDSISVFTNNIEKEPVIKSSYNSSDLKTLSNGNYSYLLYSETKNIKSNEIIDYKLLNIDTKEEVSYLINVENNIVAENNINATLTLSKDIPVGKYILRAMYDNKYFDLEINIPVKHDLLGSGTKDAPYEIYNEEDLKQIQYHLDSYFVIKRDIYLTENWEPIGTKNNPFSGNIDGENHTISYLNINKSTENAVGFIAYYNPINSFDYYNENLIYESYVSENYIKNLNFDAAKVKNTGPAGILIGDIIYDKKYIESNDKYHNITNIGEAIFNIDSVYFNYSTVDSSESDAGVIASNIDVVPASFRQPQLNINNVFSTSIIIGKTSGGLIGFINDSYNSGAGIMLRVDMTNIQNAGLINTVKYKLNYNLSKGFSHVIGKINNNAQLDIENFIINSSFKDNKYSYEFKNTNDNYGLIGEINGTGGVKNIKNGYYFTPYLSSCSYTITKIAAKASEVTDASNYKNWTDFDKYWELKTVDGTPRTPVLKNGTIVYTKFDDININLYDKYYILDNLSNNLFQNITNTNITLIDEDNNVIDFDYYDKNNDHHFDDYVINALQKGSVKLHIESSYDGNTKDILVNVTSQKVDNPIISYYKNVKGSDESVSTSLEKNVSFVINDNAFVNKGYRFNSWNTLPNGKGIKYNEKDIVSDGIDENLHLYAQWDLIKYKLVYNANNETGETKIRENLSFPVLNTAISLFNGANEFEYKYHKFNSWNTSPDGTGKKFLISNLLRVDDFINYSKNDVLNLYAIWKDNKATITYCFDNSCTNKEKYDYELGSKIAIINNNVELAGYTFRSWNTLADGNGKDYFANNEIVLNEDLILYPIYTQNFTYKINNYEVNENENYISKIKPNTSITDILTNITFGDNYSANFEVKNNLIYTGGKTKIYYNGSVVKKYTNVVTGDINGDGIINSADLLKIRQHLIGVKPLNGIYFTASDINYDNTVNSADLLRIRQHLIGTKTIE